MILRVGALVAILGLAGVPALAGDGTFGVPPSGILLPPLPQPAKTAALIPAGRAAPEKAVASRRAQQIYSPAPADGAGRSRVVPPSEAPIHSPIVVPPGKKQFRAPTASVDPDYLASVAGGAPRSLSAPVVAQGTAPGQKRGLFHVLRNRNAPRLAAQVAPAPVQLAPAHVMSHVTSSAAAAAHNEHAAMPVRTAAVTMQAASAQPATASRFSFGGARPSARANDGTPCGQLRGIFTSPAECR